MIAFSIEWYQLPEFTNDQFKSCQSSSITLSDRTNCQGIYSTAIQSLIILALYLFSSQVSQLSR